MIDVIGLGGVGTVQKPSNSVRYYTLVVYLVETIYLPRKIVCVTYDRAGYSVMIGQICCYNITQPVTQ